MLVYQACQEKRKQLLEVKSHTFVNTSESSGPDSARVLPPGAPMGFDANAILSLSKSAEIKQDRSSKDSLFLGTSRGGGGTRGKAGKERRRSASGLRLKSCQVCAKILTSYFPVEGNRAVDVELNNSRRHRARRGKRPSLLQRGLRRSELSEGNMI